MQGGGHVARHDTLGQAFHDGGLADAGLADQHRVVLGTTGEDLNHAADFLITADHRIELAFLGGGRQVGGVLLQGLVRAFRVRAGDLRAATHAGYGLAQGGCGDAVLLQDFGRLVRLAGRDADKQVLGGDVFVAHLLHFLLSLGDGGGQLAAGLRLRSAGAGCARQCDQSVTHGGADGLWVSARGLDEGAHHAVFLTQQRIHDVQGLNLRVSCGGRTLNRVADGLLGHGGELLFHIVFLHIMRPARSGSRASKAPQAPPQTATCRCLIWSTDLEPILFPKLECR